VGRGELEKALPTGTDQTTSKLDSINFQMNANQDKIDEVRNKVEK